MKRTTIRITKPSPPSTTTTKPTTTTTSTTTMVHTTKTPCDNLQAIQMLDVYDNQYCYHLSYFSFGMSQNIQLKHGPSYICSVTFGK